MLSKPDIPFILILSGPSGAGKTTLSNAVISAVPDTTTAVSHTTRQPRPGETEGKDYYYVDKPSFLALRNSGEMLEFAEVYDNFYGTSQGSVEASLVQGQNVILDIDWQGARKMKSLYPNAISVYILPPDKEESKNRLVARQQDSAEVIESRMSSYKEQQSHQQEYDHILINDKLSDAVDQLIRILHLG
jgi:guanylate kinase